MKLTDNIVGYFRRFETFATNRMVPSAVLEKEDLAYWRVRILFAIIFTGVLLGLFAFAPLITFVIKEKLWYLLILDVVAWSIGISLLLSRRIKYEIRAIITLSIFYLAGLGIIIFVGPLSGGPGWLFAFAILAGVLMGFKPAIMALTVNAITLTIIGWLINSGLFGQTFPFFNTMEAMIVAGINFILLNTVAAISVAVLVKGLVLIHQKEREATSALEIERSQLIEAKKELEVKFEERKQMQDALKEANDIINRSPAVAFLWKNAEGWPVEFVSKNVKELFGYTADELTSGKVSYVETVHPDDLERVAEEVSTFSKEKETKEFVHKPYRIITKNGEVKWLDDRTHIRRNEKREITHYEGIVLDITDHLKDRGR